MLRSLHGRVRARLRLKENPRYLLHAGFGVGVGVGTFGMAAYWRSRYEPEVTQSWRRKLREVWGPSPATLAQEPTLKERLYSLYARVSGNPPSAVVMGVVAVNLGVFGLWRVPRLQPMMAKYFMTQQGPTGTFTSHILAMFSHRGGFHFAMNMYGLMYLGARALPWLESQEEFLWMYICGGVFSSIFSWAYFTRFPQTGGFIGSLGASGALCTAIAAYALYSPNDRYHFIFFPGFVFSSLQILQGTLLLESLALLTRWRTTIDHAAHFGGLIYGVAYVTFLRDLTWAKRKEYQSNLESWWNKIAGPRSP